MNDFFISYTAADKEWAEWIAYVLEEEGFSVIIQAWDFRPGSNFVLEMQTAATSDRTIMVLSPDYLNSNFTSSEWAAAFAEDPQGLKRKLVPVVVRECQVTGLLKPLVYINLLTKDEVAARDSLIAGVAPKRSKPSQRPSFPGAGTRRPHKIFPGNLQSDREESISKAYMPNLRRVPSDLDKRRFAKQAFETIRARFQAALNELGERSDAVTCDYQQNTATEFTAEIFLNGKSASSCRIWQGGLHSSDGISYSEGLGYHRGNTFNEILAIEDSTGELHLSALMAMGYGQIEKLFDLKRLTQEQAADYLWRRFVSPLEK